MRSRFVLFMVCALISSALTIAPSLADQAQVGGQLRVVFFAPTGMDDTTNALARTKLVARAAQIAQANPLYAACVQSSDDASGTCSAAGANVIVSTVLQKVDDKNLTLVLSSTDMAGRHALGTVRRTVVVKDDKNTDTTGASLESALKLTDAEIRALIGTPVVLNGRLTIQTAAFQPFIQLIPDVASNEPTYIGVLQNLLAKRGIASVPSQFNAGTVTSGNVPADTLCGLGQRYLVYSYAKRTEDRILSLNTRVETRATGHLYDCPTRSDLAFGDTARTFATNTKGSLGPILALLGSLFVSKNQSWQNATATGGLVTTVVDRTPADIQDHSAEITLQKLVDNFCDRLGALPAPSGLASTPTPTPAASSSPGVQSDSLPGGNTPPAKTPAAAPANTNPGTDAALALDIGNFLASAPPVLTCGPPRYRDLATPRPDSPYFDRHP